jgi:hypothetical protein
MRMATIRKITIALALISIGRFVLISVLQVIYPVDLLFESPTWNTAILFHRGVNIYSPHTYDAPPFNLNIYTPLYFMIVSSIPGFSNASLMTGRIVSLFFAICALALLIVTVKSKERIQVGMIGIGWILLFQPLLINGAFFRMEFMALFFSACAVASIRREHVRENDIALAALFSFLGVMSKQSYIAAPLACASYLLWRNPKLAVRFAVIFCLLLGISFYLIDQWSGGGFLWSVLIAPRNPLSVDWFVANIESMQTPSFFGLLVLSSIACYLLTKASVGERDELKASWPQLNAIYFLTSWAWLIASIGKIGANPNYFIEPLFASVWLLLTWIECNAESWSRERNCRYALVILSIFFVWDGIITRNEPYYLFRPGMNQPDRFQMIKNEVESLKIPSSPKILNLADTRQSLSVGWDLYLNDPFLYSILWNTRTLPNRAILKVIDQGYFDLVVLQKGARPRFIPPHPSPFQQVFQKIFDRYDLKAEYTFAYYVPRSRLKQP